MTRNLEPYRQLRMVLRNLSQKLGNTCGLTYLYIIFLFYAMGLPVTYVAYILMTQGDYSLSFSPIQQFGGITLLAHLTHRAVEKVCTFKILNIRHVILHFFKYCYKYLLKFKKLILKLKIFCLFRF